MTFFVITCTVAVEDAAQNHSDSAWNVCRKRAALISLLEVLQLEDILWAGQPEKRADLVSKSPDLKVSNGFLVAQTSEVKRLLADNKWCEIIILQFINLP